MKIRIVPLLAALCLSQLAVSPAFAGSIDCSYEDGLAAKAGCYALISGIVVLGISVYAVTEMSSALTPALPVNLRVNDGEIVPAGLKSVLIGGRKVKAGETLDMRCSIASHATIGEYGFGTCVLYFPRLTPNPNALGYFEQIGSQGDFTFGINKDGWVDSSLIKLSHAIQLSEKPEGYIYSLKPTAPAPILRFDPVDQPEPSMGGDDENGNGIRDDVDAFVDSFFKDPKELLAVRQFARVIQSIMLADLSDAAAIKSLAQVRSEAINCVNLRIPPPWVTKNPRVIIARIEQVYANTKARLAKFSSFPKAPAGPDLPSPDRDTCDRS